MRDWKSADTYHRLLVAVIAAYDLKPVSLPHCFTMSLGPTVLAQFANGNKCNKAALIINEKSCCVRSRPLLVSDYLLTLHME
jgi:hypothetical protein